MIRRFGDPPKSRRHYTVRPGSYGVIVRGAQVLLTFQDSPSPEFQLPGGGIDKGECPIEALHREVLEETGWRISLSRRLGAFRRFTFMPEYDLWAEKLCHIYLCRPTICHGSPTEVGHTAIWADANTAIMLLENPGDRAFLEAALQ